jgi:hypothetical protein
MADLFLTWDELQGEQLPHYCVSCAAPATEWADWRICQSRHRVFSIDYTYVDVTLPVCPSHRKLNWFLLHRVVARDIQPDGVLVSHVSPGFVEAVWDYRNQAEAQPIQAAPRSFAPPLRSTDYEEEDYEDYSPHPLPRQRYGPGRYDHSPPGWSVGKIVLIVLAVIFFAPCGVFLLFALLGLLLKTMIG